jgi:hypothetical protein
MESYQFLTYLCIKSLIYTYIYYTDLRNSYILFMNGCVTSRPVQGVQSVSLLSLLMGYARHRICSRKFENVDYL